MYCYFFDIIWTNVCFGAETCYHKSSASPPSLLFGPLPVRSIVEAFYQVQWPVCFVVSGAGYFEIWFKGANYYEYIALTLFQTCPSFVCIVHLIFVPKLQTHTRTGL